MGVFGLNKTGEKKEKDVSFIMDYLFYLQNAVALEQHLLSSYASTKNKIQMELSQKIRTIRSKWMYRKTPESKNQIYCELKHLSACAQGLKEMGNRFLTEGKKELAEECFNDSGEMEAIFVLLNQEEKGGSENV